MAQHEFDDDWEGDRTRITEFAGMLFDLGGKQLAANVEGYLRRIDGIPVRYEGELSVVGVDCCLPFTPYWGQVVIVTSDGARMVLQCGEFRLRQLEATIIRFTTDGPPGRSTGWRR